MKISPISNQNILQTNQTSKPVSNTTKIDSGKDEVSFSNEALSLSFARVLSGEREMLAVRTPEEQAHIAKITQEIRQGTYNIDSAAVAGKILESVRGLD